MKLFIYLQLFLFWFSIWLSKSLSQDSWLRGTVFHIWEMKLYDGTFRGETPAKLISKSSHTAFSDDFVLSLLPTSTHRMPAQAPPIAGRPPSMAPDKTTARRPTEDDEARPYVIVSDIGKGSFATVYKGYHKVRISVRFLGSLSETPLAPIRTPTTRSQSSPSGEISLTQSSLTICKVKLRFSSHYPIAILRSLSTLWYVASYCC